jgi:hypothetical protein
MAAVSKLNKTIKILVIVLISVGIAVGVNHLYQINQPTVQYDPPTHLDWSLHGT